MEDVHKISKRVWVDDNLINVRRFKDNFCEAASYMQGTNESRNKFLKNRISSEEYTEIENMCGLETMRCFDQEIVEISSNITLSFDPQLETLRLQAEDLKKRRDIPKYANALYHNAKYCNYPPNEILGLSTGINSNLNYEEVDLPEVVLSVQFFVPERRIDTKFMTASTKVPTFTVDQEFLVLGCQYLTELRDKIDCISDKAVPGDYSDCPTFEPSITCKDIYKSGYFYINGTFYNDMRDKDCRDYSEPIIKWTGSERGIGPFTKRLMEETRFIDLTIRLGCPYVYTHQGECEHVFVFNDLRMFSNQDERNRNAYPLYVSVKTCKRIFCMTCHAYTATWVVYDNKRLPENPFFFCKHCFMSFNYDEEGQKIGNFRAYHLPDRTRLF